MRHGASTKLGHIVGTACIGDKLPELITWMAPYDLRRHTLTTAFIEEILLPEFFKDDALIDKDRNSFMDSLSQYITSASQIPLRARKDPAPIPAVFVPGNEEFLAMMMPLSGSGRLRNSASSDFETPASKRLQRSSESTSDIEVRNLKAEKKRLEDAAKQLQAVVKESENIISDLKADTAKLEADLKAMKSNCKTTTTQLAKKENEKVTILYYDTNI